MFKNVEDALEQFVIDGVPSSCIHIITSINKQCLRSIALTDRQFTLVSEKLTESGYEFLSVTRLPLREIDRSKYIKIVDNYIKIRFPFSKKLIVALESVANKHRRIYKSESGSHEHFFKLRELPALDIYNEFKDRNFEIDQQFIDYVEEVKKIQSQEDKFVTAYKDDTFYNLSDNAVKHIKEELTEITQEKMYDRRLRYGISKIDKPDVYGLVETILDRPMPLIQISPNTTRLDDLVTTLMQLERLPLLVITSQHSAQSDLYDCHKATKNLIANDKQICLFRVENNSDDDYNMNNYIKDENLNNWLDEKIEIAYIKYGSIPKLLLKTNWKPKAIISFSSSVYNTETITYMKNVCDLNVIYDDFVRSSFLEGRMYGSM